MTSTPVNYKDFSKEQLIEKVYELQNSNLHLLETLKHEKKLTKYLKSRLFIVKKFENELMDAAQSFEQMSLQFAKHINSAMALQEAMHNDGSFNTFIEEEYQKVSNHVNDVSNLQNLPTDIETSLGNILHTDQIGCIGWEFLRIFPPFKDLPMEILQALAEVTYELKRKAGQIIIRKGEEGAEVFFIASGSVHLLRRSDFAQVAIMNGDEEVSLLQSKTFFGDVGGLSPQERSATVKAKTDCVLFVITKQKIHDVLQKYGDVHLEKIKEFVEHREKWWKATRRLSHNEHFGGEFMMEIAKSDIIKLPLFAQADQVFIEELVLQLVPEVYKKEDTIISKDQEADAMFFIVHGSVAIIGGDGDIHANLVAGQFFGEIGILLDTKRTATVKANEDCYILKLRKDALAQVSKKHPEMQKQVNTAAAERYELIKKRNTLMPSPSSLLNTNSNTLTVSNSLASSSFNSVPDECDVEVNRQNLRRDVDQSIVDELANTMERGQVAAGAYIIRCGDKADSMFFLAHGKVEIVSEVYVDKYLTNKFGQVFDRSEGPQAYFGEVALIEDLPRTASVRAATECSIYTLKKSDMIQTFKKCPALEDKIRETAQERLQAHLMRNVLA